VSCAAPFLAPSTAAVSSVTLMESPTLKVRASPIVWPSGGTARLCAEETYPVARDAMAVGRNSREGLPP
jgi:hypothetical protein